MSDDAAQKRVSRAVERLREYFTNRGVTVGVGGLTALISTNAVQAAPVGLALTISTTTAAAVGSTFAATTTTAATTTATATKAIAMTTLQKTIVGAALAAAVGTGIYEAHQASRLRNQVQELQAEQAGQIEQMSREKDEATQQLAAFRERFERDAAELASLRGEITRLRNRYQEFARSNAANNSIADTRYEPDPSGQDPRLDRVNELKRRLEQTPNAKIPELQFLTDDDWLYAARNPLETDNDYRKAFAELRHVGENRFLNSMWPALQDYLKASQGQFPTDVLQLKPFFKTIPDDAMLQRYEIMSSAILALNGIPVDSDQIITVRNPVDEQHDALWYLGADGLGTTSYQGMYDLAALVPTLKAYSEANNGQQPKRPSDLLPYLATPAQRAAYEKLENMRNSALE